MKRTHRVLLPNELRSFIRSAKKDRRFSLEFAFNTGLTPLELIRVSRNIETLFNEHEHSIRVPGKGSNNTGGRTIFLSETFSDSLAINFDKLNYPSETSTRKRLRVTIPKYQAWLQWYKRLGERANIIHPEEIRLLTNRYTWGYYLYATGVGESLVSEQLGLTEDSKFYKSFTLSRDPNKEDIRKYTHDWKGNL
ncbi:site-specific integrase [Candidatus Dependentiae bacterium]|nr:site-specific integrase [Candidatus Dependentiae bacterium]